MLGAVIEQNGTHLSIEGVAGKPRVPDDVIDCGNSGQVLRFAAAIAAIADGATVVTGDQSVRSNRPVKPMLDGLNQLGGRAFSTRGNDHAPIVIEGPIKAGTATIDGQDSQPVSGLLMAMAFMEGDSTLHVTNPGETPWVGLTLDWFKRLGITCTHENYTTYHVKGGHVPEAFEYDVPGDFSSIAYPVVAALVTGSDIEIGNVDMADSQGDKKLIDALISMGAKIDYDAPSRTLSVSGKGALQGKVLDVNDYIDAVPILSVVGSYATGQTTITNCAIARAKESDRLATTTSELKKIGGDIVEHAEELVVSKASLHGGEVTSHHDHRIAMSMAVAALAASGPVLVQDVDCVSKSYPAFWDDLEALGARIWRTS